MIQCIARITMLRTGGIGTDVLLIIALFLAPVECMTQYVKYQAGTVCSTMLYYYMYPYIPWIFCDLAFYAACMGAVGVSISHSAPLILLALQKIAKKMAMKYSCKSAFHMMQKACSLHKSVLEPEELEKYKLLGGWTSDANWDDELKDREAEVKSNKWVGGVPSQIRKQEASIRKHQEEQRKIWDPIMLG